MGPTLLAAGALGGACALILPTGEIDAGLRANTVAITLSGAEWDGLHDDPAALPGALGKGGGRALVRHLWVGGMKIA